MTAGRHREYRRALALLATLEDGWLGPAGGEILRDWAEHMLLCRESDPEAIRALRREVKVAVRELAVAGELPRTIASELTELIARAGPPLRRHAGARTAA